LTHIVASSYDFNLTLEGGSSDGNPSSSSRTLFELEKEHKQQDSIVNRKLKMENIDNDNSMMYLDDDETVVLFRGDSAEEDQLFDTNDTKETKKQHQHHTRVTAEDEEAQKQIRNAKIEATMKLAQQRHLVRRYKVAKLFLENSIKHLLLDG
jgi:hypothetical protein